jgi:hypothetical protein
MQKGSYNKDGSESKGFQLTRGQSEPLPGLVGKATDINEATITNTEYVRVQIACREVTQVPTMAEGTLGLMIYDFFEREVEATEGNRMEKVPTKIQESGDPPSPKRHRMETLRNVEKDKSNEGKEST